MKTIEQILLDSLKDKHVTGYYLDYPEPSFSGIVHDVRISLGLDYDSMVLYLTLNTGSNLEYFEYALTDIKLDIC
jgi:hypothetical protein